MNLESIKQQGNNEKLKPIRERVFLPHVEAIVKAYERHFGKEKKMEPGETEALKEIIYSYFEQRIEKTFIYKSEKLGASFAYNVTNTADLAKTLYSKYAGNKKLELKEGSEELPGSEKEFMFIGGLVNPKDGNEYSSQEEVMHRMIKELPGALQAISEGREPKKKEIYTLASPTNELGNISQKFMDGLENEDASAQFGLLYADLIQSILSQGADGKNTNVYFSGVSMGAGFAIETAKKLIADGIVTQTYDKDDNRSLLQIRIDMPPGQSDTSPKIKKIQIPAGFVLEFTHAFIVDPYMRSVMGGNTRFVASKNEILAERGIKVNMSLEQIDLKKKVISKIQQSLERGVPIPDTLKVTEVVGTSDPIMYSRKFQKRVEEKRDRLEKERETEPETKGKSLGENLVSDPQNPNRRTLAISSTHIIPFLRTNEFQRLHRAVESLTSLKG